MHPIVLIFQTENRMTVTRLPETAIFPGRRVHFEEILLFPGRGAVFRMKMQFYLGAVQFSFKVVFFPRRGVFFAQQCARFRVRAGGAVRLGTYKMFNLM